MDTTNLMPYRLSWYQTSSHGSLGFYKLRVIYDPKY